MSGVDKKFKSPFAVADAGILVPPAGHHGTLEVVGEDEEGCLGPGWHTDGTRAEVCTSRPGAHGADEPTRVVVDLGDPVARCLASTGRCDGGWVYSEFQMAEDLANDLALRDDSDEPQHPTLTQWAGGHLQVKHASQEPRPGPIQGTCLRCRALP